jgi:hypothetical protein
MVLDFRNRLVRTLRWKYGEGRSGDRFRQHLLAEPKDSSPKMAAAHSSETLGLVPTFITYSRRILLSAGLRNDTNLRIW